MPDDAPPASPARILPALTPYNRQFWTGGVNGRLMIARCSRCDMWVHPPAADCPICGGPLVAEPVSGRGSVFTFTVNYQPFNPVIPVPYVIAIVELAEQADLRIATNIVDCEPGSVYVGMPVKVRFERHDAGGESMSFPLFAPRLSRSP